MTLSFLQDPGQPPDPDVFYGSEGLLLTRNIYEGLVQYQPGRANPKIVPDLATSWEIGGDGLTYTFQLRHGVLFHDGTPFDSSAIAATFARRSAVDGGPAYMVSDVAKVTTDGPYTVVITLKAANSAFLSYLASSYGPVMESPTALKLHAGTDDDQTYLETHDVGTGPYELTKASVGNEYQLTAFPRYWGTKPYYTTVNVPVLDDATSQELQFNDGQIAAILHDLTTSAIKQYQNDKKISFFSLPSFENEGVFVNPHRGFLTSAKARKAVLQAIDAKAIVQEVFQGTGHLTNQALPGGILPSSTGRQGITYDPAALRNTLSHLTSSQKKITVGYDSGAAADQLVAENIGAELTGLGLRASVVAYPTSTAYGWVGSVHADKTSAPNILVYYGWPDSLSPYTWNHASYDSDGGFQWFTCDVPGADSLDAKALAKGSDALYSKVITSAVKTGCFYNFADRDDVFVTQKWLKGVSKAYVYTMPYALLLDGLHPGDGG